MSCRHVHNSIATTNTNKTNGVQQTHSPKKGVRNQLFETTSMKSPPKCTPSCVCKFIAEYYFLKKPQDV